MKNMALILITLTSTSSFAFTNLGSLNINSLATPNKQVKVVKITKPQKNTKNVSYFDRLRIKFNNQHSK
jgi:hypothetical protein